MIRKSRWATAPDEFCELVFISFQCHPTFPSLQVLAIVLRDGVLLCSLLEFLDNTIDMKSYHRKPQMAQVSKKKNKMEIKTSFIQLSSLKSILIDFNFYTVFVSSQYKYFFGNMQSTFWLEGIWFIWALNVVWLDKFSSGFVLFVKTIAMQKGSTTSSGIRVSFYNKNKQKFLL